MDKYILTDGDSLLLKHRCFAPKLQKVFPLKKEIKLNQFVFFLHFYFFTAAAVQKVTYTICDFSEDDCKHWQTKKTSTSIAAWIKNLNLPTNVHVLYLLIGLTIIFSSWQDVH